MFEMNLQLFGGGGSKSGLGGGGGPFDGMGIQVDGNQHITYGFVYKDKNGTPQAGSITGRTEVNAQDKLKDKNIRVSDKTFMAKNFFDKARQIAKEKGEKVDWEAAKEAYKKAYKKYFG